jgi:hypothetical protein
VTIAFLLSAVGLAAGAGTVEPFTPGEELRYEVDILGIHAGMTQVDVGSEEVVANHRTWPIVVVAKTEGAADSLYQERERYVSFWDFEHQQVVQGQLTANEMGRHHTLATRFERDAPGGPRAQVEIGNDRGTERLMIPIESGTQDLAAAIFWLRHRPLKPGDVENVPVISSKRNWILRARVLDRASIETPAGTFPAVRVSLTTHLAGKIQASGDVEAYFSDDFRHLPLRVESKFMIGKIRAQLTRYAAGMPLRQFSEGERSEQRAH